MIDDLLEGRAAPPSAAWPDPQTGCPGPRPPEWASRPSGPGQPLPTELLLKTGKFAAIGEVRRVARVSVGPGPRQYPVPLALALTLAGFGLRAREARRPAQPVSP
ncbi:hypothetical protein BCD49_21900 [Pseudofrankia sp. EUN1h]|nr:hypothetical protein BCD49_21900 [Pseudofrankia sp. EUN1h]